MTMPNIKSPWGEVLALCAGAAMPLAFAPTNAYPLAILCLAALFLVWQGISAARAAWRGFFFGLGAFGFGVSWVFIAIHHYGDVPLPLSLLLTGGLVVFLALYPALTGYLAAKSFSKASGAKALGVALVGLAPLLWVLLEWVRGWFFTGFPWLNVGYSQIGGPLKHYAPLIGVYGVSWVTAVSAGLVAWFVLGRSVCERVVSLLVFIVLWGAGALLAQVSWTAPASNPIRVSLVQGNVPQDIKWLPEVQLPTMELYASLSRRNWASDLIVWPETALPDFLHRQQDYLDGLRVEALANRTEILLGVLTMDLESERYYNSMVSVGGQEGVYHKRHLVPFTEYLPLKNFLGRIVDFMNVPMSDFSSGERDQALVNVAGQPVGISICFEDAFGEEVIGALPEATLLVNVSNDAWFGESNAPAQHLQIARMRALETGRPLLRATNTGLTAIVDAKGAIQKQAPQFETYVLTDTVEPMAGMTPYSRVGNGLIVGLLLGLWPILLIIGRHNL